PIFGLWALFRGFVSYNITFIGLIYNLIITPECAEIIMVEAVVKGRNERTTYFYFPRFDA
ncbi:MAG: hypothetical protein CSA36_00175, partial [Draconibacterium sp.]